MKVSVVIPVHNEANILPLTSDSIYAFKADETIFILDRCTDGTPKSIEQHYLGNIHIFIVKQKHGWNYHLNFLYDLGIRNAKNPIVLLSQADIILDVIIKKHLNFALGNMVSFGVSEHPHVSPWNHFITRALQSFGSKIGIQCFSGVLAINKNEYLSHPLKPSDLFMFDTQLQQNFPNYKFESSHNLNVRPWTRNKLWRLGLDRYHLGKSLWNALLFSMLRLAPKVFAGYAYGKWRKDDAAK